MDVSDQQFSRETYTFTNLPARPVLLLTLLGIPLALYLDPSFPSETPLRGNTLSPLVVVGVISISLALIFSYRIVRQLRTISLFYSRAGAVDLYDLDPVYALASHAARTGLALLVALYSSILNVPDALESPSLFIAVAILTLLALGAFLLPLRGINRRLVEKKKELLRSTQRRIKKAFEQLEASVDANELPAVKELDSAVSALKIQKEFIDDIPTWPWHASTMRAFITLMLLPLSIWAFQQILGRFFGL